MIRFAGSWLFSYKGISGDPGEADLSSIQKPHPDISSHPEFFQNSKDIWDWLLENRRSAFPALQAAFTDPSENWFDFKFDFFPQTSAGPTSACSVGSIDKDAAYIFSDIPGNLMEVFRQFSKHWGRPAFDMFRRMKDMARGYQGELSPVCPPIGRLSVKQEAAGKVRVFAMVDNLTQIILRPIHDFLIKGLQGFGSSDATMDQTGSVAKFSKIVAERKLPLYSYDLKSATDLIPRVLYQVGLTPIFGEDRVRSWLSLLVDRDFAVGDPNRPGTITGFPAKSPSVVRYQTGQPIGALSSWASLAWIHHLIVATAAKRAGFTVGTFWDYIILGDDIVIANTSVAEAYLSFCQELSIPISLTKSFVSLNGTFNFANQMFIDWTTNVSPASMREEISITSFDMRLESARRLISRWVGRISSIADILSFVTHPARYSETYRELRVTQDLVDHSPAQCVMSLVWYPHSSLRALGVPITTIEPLASVVTGTKQFFSGLETLRKGGSLAPEGYSTYLVGQLLWQLIHDGTDLLVQTEQRLKSLNSEATVALSEGTHQPSELIRFLVGAEGLAHTPATSLLNNWAATSDPGTAIGGPLLGDSLLIEALTPKAPSNPAPSGDPNPGWNKLAWTILQSLAPVDSGPLLVLNKEPEPAPGPFSGINPNGQGVVPAWVSLVRKKVVLQSEGYIQRSLRKCQEVEFDLSVLFYLYEQVDWSSEQIASMLVRTADLILQIPMVPEVSFSDPEFWNAFLTVPITATQMREHKQIRRLTNWLSLLGVVHPHSNGSESLLLKTLRDLRLGSIANKRPSGSGKRPGTSM